MPLLSIDFVGVHQESGLLSCAHNLILLDSVKDLISIQRTLVFLERHFIQNLLLLFLVILLVSLLPPWYAICYFFFSFFFPLFFLGVLLTIY